MTPPARVDAEGAAGLLAGARPVTVICHVDPDADAIGSAAALGLALSRGGREVHVTFDPGVVPTRLSSIPGAELVRPLAEVPAHDGLVVIVDCASRDRTGRADELLDAATDVLVVDHHRSNPGFGTHLLLEADAPSTTALLLDLLGAAGLGLDAPVATALYAGLVTDTGSFRWGGAEAHRRAAVLLDAGADTDLMGFELLDARDAAWFAVKAEILAGVRVEPGAARGRGIVWLVADDDQVRRAGEGAVETLVDEVRGVRGTSVAVVLRQRGPGTWSVSMRSRDGVDVGAAATALGGGGHAAAAGCTLNGTPEAIADRIRAALD